MWTLNPGEFVHINLEKKQERWWEHVFVDEPKINTRKIDCSRPMTDLDDEAQAKIEEMMYNQRQKQLGLPQSHELKTHEMLGGAWDAEGSPFKGQPFDPSKFNVDTSGIVNFDN
uniref:CS domain-containing protein n=1 Tax=Biomphalaria glabrata TaxID=6526 RepID=A0A2C9KRN4_BIOGL